MYNIVEQNYAFSFRTKRRPTAGVTGGWGEKDSQTENCQSSEPAPKNAQSPSCPVHALLAGVFTVGTYRVEH